MSSVSITRRSLLAGVAVASVTGVALPATRRNIHNAFDNEVRQFLIDIPEADLIDLRRRLAATRWPDRETVTDD